jgi:inhibitor of KinA
MELKPLGDQAVLAYLPDENAAVRFAAAVRAAGPAWLLDVVPAYASVGIFFDPDRAATDEVMGWLATMGECPGIIPNGIPSRRHVIPVCYEMQQDMARVADTTRLSPDDIIRLHAGTEYTVYAIGFVPGFPYLGYLPEPMCGVGRLPAPRVRVEPGSVGMTGRQTGIYPLPRPGGWNLIGRTPLRIFRPEQTPPVLLAAGDRVKFRAITPAEFAQQEGKA